MQYYQVKYKAITAIVLMSWVPSLIAQNVCEANSISTQAEIHYRQKTNLKDAVKLYKSSFKLDLTDASKVLDAINASTLIEDTSSTIGFLENAISVGLSTKTLRELWSRMGNGMDLVYLISAIDTATLTKQYQFQLDSTLIRQLSFMVEKDQKYRGEEEFDWRSQNKLDSFNWEELKTIVLKLNRLPVYKELGLEGYDDLEILFHHMDKEAIEWFLPHIVYSAQNDNANLSRVVLYQLDRIGMSEGVIYTITEDLKIIELDTRTKMRNGFYCQTWGEWFYAKSHDLQLYEIPIDPKIPFAEVNRIRELFCLDPIELKRKRRPWVQTVEIKYFEELIKE